MDAAWPAEAELHEVGVVNVQIEQRAPGFGALEEMALSPGGWFGYAAEARREHLAEPLILDCCLEPGPLRPEAHAHRGHEEAGGGVRGGRNFARRLGYAGQWLLANDMLARFQCGDRELHVRFRRGADVDDLNVRISEQVCEIPRGFDAPHV